MKRVFLTSDEKKLFSLAPHDADDRNLQGSPYKINGRNCYDHAGQPCKLYSRARDVVRLAKESGADLVSVFFFLDFTKG